jgi:hypothetical protein
LIGISSCIEELGRFDEVGIFSLKELVAKDP